MTIPLHKPIKLPKIRLQTPRPQNLTILFIRKRKSLSRITKKINKTTNAKSLTQRLFKGRAKICPAVRLPSKVMSKNNLEKIGAKMTPKWLFITACSSSNMLENCPGKNWSNTLERPLVKLNQF